MFDPVEEESGREGKDVGLRRWRLIMYFHDHTVLTYELGKYAGEGEAGLDELIV